MNLGINKLFCLLVFILFGIPDNLYSQASYPEGQNKVRQTWHMHRIRDDYLIANSMNAADVDKDGYDDYAIIDEWLGLQTIVFYPTASQKIRNYWDRVNLGITGNPEYSCLGDLDGDGNMDFIVATGDDLERGYKTGVGIFWGPEPDKVRDSAAWEYSGLIPSSTGQQYLYVEVHDIDGDGAVDILAGGRRNAITDEYAGIRWFKAPDDKKSRRDLTEWDSYYIDADAYSGHGFVFTDIDQDGDNDIVLADADWDTPAFERKLYWYENPGNTKSVTNPWEQHIIWKNSSFYAKPQVATGDLNEDGLTDLCVQTQNFIHLFLKKQKDPVEWDHIRVMKPENIQWIGRPVRIADLDMNGKMDIVGMLIHHDGNLPADKASVFWMEYEGDQPGDKWKFHPLKWSDGYNSYREWAGEKWDHCLIRDVDLDGDPDIVANVEEHYYWPSEEYKDPVSYFSVVWFENPLK